MRNLEILARKWYFHVIWKFSASPVIFAKVPVGVRSLSLVAVAILAQDAGGRALRWGPARDGSRLVEPDA